MIHGLPVKSSKSDWLTMRNEYSAHAQDIGSRSQPQARRIVGSGDENDPGRSEANVFAGSEFIPLNCKVNHAWGIITCCICRLNFHFLSELSEHILDRNLLLCCICLQTF